MLQREYPEHPLLHAPEFLTEATAEHDELYPHRKIVGYTEASRDWAEGVLGVLPSAPYERVVPATTAELIKYFANVFYAVTVSYVNQFYDLCQALDVDYDRVREAAEADPMMSSSHLQAWHKGYRGYGGKCLPKDARALITLAERMNVDLGVPLAAQRYNDRLVSHAAQADRESHHPRCGPCASG
jgi:nucleotide sugar dehydrogenase